MRAVVLERNRRRLRIRSCGERLTAVHNYVAVGGWLAWGRICRIS